MPERDWTLARAKVDAETHCRGCGRPDGLEAAHVIGREHDTEPPCRWPSDQRWITSRVVQVAPDRVVPLCGPSTSTDTCHGKAHALTLEWLPILTVAEQAQAVADAGGLHRAMMRLDPDYRAWIRHPSNCTCEPAVGRGAYRVEAEYRRDCPIHGEDGENAVLIPF